MENRLFVTIYKQRAEWEQLEQKLETAFGVQPSNYTLPVHTEIKEKMKSKHGDMRCYQLMYGTENFPETVFALLTQVESFGFDWKFRKPIEISQGKHLFLLSLFSDFGTIQVEGVQGISIALFEGREDE